MSHFCRLFLLTCLLAGGLLGGCSRSNNPDELVMQAEQQLTAGKIKDAASAINRAVKLAPDRFDALILQAIILERRGKAEEAIAAARRAVELQPDSFVAQYTLGCLYAADSKYYHDALIAFGKALNIRPNHRYALIQLVNVAIKLNPEQAMKPLFSLARYPNVFNSADYQNLYGIGLIQRRQYQAAEMAFLKACRLKPGNPTYWLNLAVCMDRYLNKGSQAVKIYKQYLTLAPQTPDATAKRKQVEARLQLIGGRG